MLQKFLLYGTLKLFIYIAAAKNSKDCFATLSTTPTTVQKGYYEMSFIETANTSVTNEMFTCFLKESRYSDDEKSVIENNFDIYKMCREFQRNSLEQFGKKQLNELVQLHMQQSLVSYLRDGIKSGKKAYIEESLAYIVNVTAKYIESSQEYKDYKKLILRKMATEPSPTNPTFHNNGEHFIEVTARSKNSGQRPNHIGGSFKSSLYIMLACQSFFFVVMGIKYQFITV